MNINSDGCLKVTLPVTMDTSRLVGRSLLLIWSPQQHHSVSLDLGHVWRQCPEEQVLQAKLCPSAPLVIFVKETLSERWKVCILAGDHGSIPKKKIIKDNKTIPMCVLPKFSFYYGAKFSPPKRCIQLWKRQQSVVTAPWALLVF